MVREHDENFLPHDPALDMGSRVLESVGLPSCPGEVVGFHPGRTKARGQGVWKRAAVPLAFTSASLI